MNSFDSKEFRKLQAKWYKKLEKSGFDDIEDINGHCRSPDRRTISWKNRDAIRDFYMNLDGFLHEMESVPRRDKRVLKLWTKGTYLVDIAKKTGLSIITVKRIVYKYKEFVLRWSSDTNSN